MHNTTTHSIPGNNSILEKHSSLPRCYSPNLIISHAKGDYVWDTHMRRYLDFTGAIAVNSFGHCDEKISACIALQSQKIMHCSNIFSTNETISLCNELTQLARKEFKESNFCACFLCNSGTEANEAALKFARLHWYRKGMANKKQLLSFYNSFHGRSMGALSVTGQKKYREPFEPLLPETVQIAYNDSDALTQTVNENTAAVIVEIIQGEGGLHSLHSAFAQQLMILARKFSFLIIVDEVQTGLCRTGPFFSCTATSLQPDIITLAKSLGGGLPAGAVIYKKEIQEELQSGDHGSTLGGNPLCSAVALTVLARLRDKKFRHAQEKSHSFLKRELERICNTNPQLRIRGKGHLRGIELPETIPRSIAQSIIARCREQGLLVLGSGTHCIRIAPSLICPPSILADGLRILEQVLQPLLL